MKRLFFGFAIFMTLQVNAQNYLISFEGKGESETVSTVKVENLTAGTSLTLNGSDILSLTFISGIDPIWDNQSRLKIYPNPMVDNSTLEFFPPVAGDATITICDITGKPIAQDHSYLEKFRQNFKLTGLKNGFYLINVVGNGYRFSGKLVSNGESNGTISIEKVINNTKADYEKQVKIDIKGVQGTIDMDFSLGEMLRFTGSSGDYSAVVMDIPTSNKIITFNFTGVPTLTTSTTTAISSTTATSGGTITSDGGESITARGVCWSTTTNPTVALSTKTSNETGTGSFTSNITGLQPFTAYHVRAYATNSAGTAYGNDRTFTTLPIAPSLTTTAASAITRTTAASGGNITSDGGATVSNSGICWSTSHNPSITGSHTSDGTANGSFISSMNGLLPGTLYYIRAYATNSVGTSYGDELSFTTNPAIIASLTTTVVSSITPVTAVSGGNITDDGDGTITARGICWATTPSPTISDNLTSNGTGTGSFTSNITGLQPVTTYHVRAYATNSAGTAYGSDLSFTTLAVVPTVTSAAVSAITQTTATAGGNVTANGGASVTARGVCWNTSTNPKVANSHTSDGTGDGVFTSNLTGLTPNTRYYVRAYATNYVGTAYGNEVTFMYIIPEINTCNWLRDAPCFLSLSFDDSQAAHLEIANLLSGYGIKGTFYIHTADLEVVPSLKDVYKNILLSGHEIGSHTVNHFDLTTLSEQELNYEIDSSVSRINRYLNTNCTSLAHPYHSTNNYINNIIFGKNLFTRNYSEYFSSERPRLGLTSSTEISTVTNFIDEQIANKSSCLIAGHGINGSGYSPSTTEFFIALLNYVQRVQNNNKVWVTTMSNGALYESLFYEVKLTSQIDQSNRQIKIKFLCPSKAIYNKLSELLFSFKINKSSSWSIQNSGIEYIETDTQYIYTIDLKQTREVTLQYTITE